MQTLSTDSLDKPLVEEIVTITHNDQKCTVKIRTAISSDFHCVWNAMLTQPESLYEFIPPKDQLKLSELYEHFDLDHTYILNAFGWDYFHHDEEEFMGYATISFSQDPSTQHLVRLGIIIMADYQGSGLGAHFGRIIEEFLLRIPTVSKVLVNIMARNIRSINLNKKYGMQEEGYITKFWKSHRLDAGGNPIYQDVVILGKILR